MGEARLVGARRKRKKGRNAGKNGGERGKKGQLLPFSLPPSFRVLRNLFPKTCLLSRIRGAPLPVGTLRGNYKRGANCSPFFIAAF